MNFERVISFAPELDDVPKPVRHAYLRRATGQVPHQLTGEDRNDAIALLAAAYMTLWRQQRDGGAVSSIKVGGAQVSFASPSNSDVLATVYGGMYREMTDVVRVTGFVA